MQVGAIRDIDNGGRSFWTKKKYDRNCMNSKYISLLLPAAVWGHIDLSASEDFERIFTGRYFEFPHRGKPFPRTDRHLNLSKKSNKHRDSGSIENGTYSFYLNPTRALSFCQYICFFNYYQTFAHI